AAFVKAIPELSPIQWLRVLDRRQLVASVTREGEDESAVVVRSILGAAMASAELELGARCSVFSAVERAAFALAARARLSDAQVRRHRLSAIKFAVSYAPFASAVVVTKPSAIAPVVQRYLTAVGRLSAHQCAVLGEPWLLADDVSNALARATPSASTRAAEEA